ncbi:glutaredoxin 1 [Vibrio phage vB_VmeM-Yong XC32]|nr:glutaredoxin 1 [Vibrio phage vB_VmeM-Yong XC31]QAX96322.1 glutaredoxin 1 [Vibrio phage vB_VmeM-Yong XC32]QAX96640.1 glutaredoxin 1 [Vibrio phage vB_VmeM-Yong MS31]QAX96958.1 glutaredoxin 1 [Vibrio phage vB_VmeM-Yong MS32]
MLIAIFGRPNCPYCDKAKALAEELTSQGHSYIYKDIQKENISKAELARICDKPVETVPQIFVNGQHIGGYTEMEAKFKS